MKDDFSDKLSGMEGLEAILMMSFVAVRGVVYDDVDCSIKCESIADVRQDSRCLHVLSMVSLASRSCQIYLPVWR